MFDNYDMQINYESRFLKTNYDWAADIELYIERNILDKQPRRIVFILLLQWVFKFLFFYYK